MAVHNPSNPLLLPLDTRGSPRRFEKRSNFNIKSDFTLFPPSSPLDNFLCQTSDPISSRLFSQPTTGSYSMDTTTIPTTENNSTTEKYKPYLPSPLYVRDPETSSPTSDHLSYTCSSGNTKFNPPQQGQGQGGIHNSLPLGRMRDTDPSQRIPYSPESLASEYRYSTSGQETQLNRTTPKARGTSPSGGHNPPMYGINESAGPGSYFSASFSLEKEQSGSRNMSNNRGIPRSSSRYHPYPSTYGTPSPHADGTRAASYDERMIQGGISQRGEPLRSSFNGESEYSQNSPPHQSRVQDEHREAASQWPRTAWLTTATPDLTSSQQSSSGAPYPTSYTPYDSSANVYRAPSVYAPPYESGAALPIQLRHGGIETLNSNQLANAIHCPHCTQKFPTTEQFTKHQQKHQKMYRCRFDNCSRTEGFATPNDRERHEKSVHKIPGFYWRCLDPNCSSFRKEFARRDNLKDHLKRMHTMPPGVDEAEANAWRSQMADNGKYEKPDTQMSGQ
ncbi:uncharacterized protein LAJ45_00092 [Morchella importuna]|uniref:uncharacterized protein n=1 Tax=Morchella importuna TaxID=1174673 RepID=UPI001E8E925E|nr:uncharacterized protein LAJ45_00092 [Morchella importuna]KAH8155083.1 hypothetical protein LAJ45_00092 [Morchella importuna]